MKGKPALEIEAIAFAESGTGYAAAFEFNGLYEVNLEEQKCIYKMLFPNEKVNGKRLYASALHVASKIYFVPTSGEYISIYDIEKKTIEQLSVPLPATECSFYKKNCKFIKAVQWGENIFIIPFTYPGILKLNIKTNRITVLRRWIPQEGYFFRGGLCIEGNCIYIPSGNNNIILEFNMETEKGIIHRIGRYNNGAMDMYKYGENYWIVPRQKGSIAVWNPESNFVSEITDYPAEFQAEKIVFSKIIHCEDKLFFMPGYANSVLTVKTESKELVLEERWKPQENSVVTFRFETDECYYFREVNKLSKQFRRFKIYKEDGRTEEYALETERQEVFQSDRLNLAVEQGEIIAEIENFKLEDLLSLI